MPRPEINAAIDAMSLATPHHEQDFWEKLLVGTMVRTVSPVARIARVGVDGFIEACKNLNFTRFSTPRS